MSLNIKNLSITAGSFTIRSLDIEIVPGEYFVLMGPTGSGKSLLLKAICGLHNIDNGTILISGNDVTSLHPGKRKIGYVPQDSALFPNMNVRANIQFSFDVKGRGSIESGKKVNSIAEMLHIENLLDRSTLNLSGGETQKVALARALAAEPDILIFDEPVSAVDEATRYEICSELVRIQKKLNISTIHVCHSIEEAKSVSDRIGIMLNGEICSVGQLDEIMESKIEDPAIRRLLCSKFPSVTAG